MSKIQENIYFFFGHLFFSHSMGLSGHFRIWADEKVSSLVKENNNDSFITLKGEH
jgi:hypothetical protein